MGSPIQVGLDTKFTELLDALGRFCEAEGLTASNLHSINFLEDEVDVVIVRADGGRRHNIYPMAAFRARGRSTDMPARSSASEGGTNRDETDH